MDISIKWVLQELVRRAWIIILCAIIGLGCAYVYTKQTVAPIYVTTMKVSALTNVTDDETASVSVGSYINMLTLAQRRVQTYIELFKTTQFYEQVAVASGTGYTAGAVGSMLQFEQVENMGIFSVTITGTDPLAIKAIGDAIGQEMCSYIEIYQSHAQLAVLEPAKVPSYPTNEIVKRNSVMGFLVGAVLAAGLIALVAYFDTHIKDEDSLSQRYDIPVLGSIPDFSVVTDNKKK